MRVLLIEDDIVLTEELSLMLRKTDIHVDVANCGEEGMELAALYEYDVVILDLGLPDIIGEEVIVRLRKKQIDVPILVLSGHSEVARRLAALRAGADDFLLKPFNRQELVARIHALVRRANGHYANMIQFGDLTLDLRNRDVRVGDKSLPLTATEYQMLELLCLKSGGVVSKENFLNHLYGGIDEPEMKIIDVFICKLRKKIEYAGTAAGTGQSIIETVWGRGYRMGCA